MVIDMIDSRPQQTAGSDVLSVGGGEDGIVGDREKLSASRDDCSNCDCDCDAKTVPCVYCDAQENRAVQGPEDGAIGRR